MRMQQGIPRMPGTGCVKNKTTSTDWVRGEAVCDEDSMTTTPRLTSRLASRSRFVLHTSGSGHLWNTLLGQVGDIDIQLSEEGVKAHEISVAYIKIKASHNRRSKAEEMVFKPGKHCNCIQNFSEQRQLQTYFDEISFNRYRWERVETRSSTISDKK